jgi:hypothetical protein
MIDRVTDEPSPEDLEQLARSVAMAGALGDCDRLDVAAALRRLADIDKSTPRYPSNGTPNQLTRKLTPGPFRPENDETPAPRCLASVLGFCLVELRRIELLTSSMPWKRSTN